MSRTPARKGMPVKVMLEKTGTHVEVTVGPYTKRELRELLLSSLSLLSESGDRNREAELIRLSGVDLNDMRRIKDGQIFGADGMELFAEAGKKSAAIRLVNLIANEGKRDPENDLINLLRSKGISDDLNNRILTYGLNDETMRLLRALGFTDQEIAELLGMWRTLSEQRIKSEESCSSVPSSSEEYMTVESFYLMGNFKNPLTKALSDIVSKKPRNPAEYLGHWLLNYKICEERAQKKKEFDAELLAERERRRFVVNVESNVSEVDEEEEEFMDDCNFIEYD